MAASVRACEAAAARGPRREKEKLRGVLRQEKEQLEGDQRRAAAGSIKRAALSRDFRPGVLEHLHQVIVPGGRFCVVSYEPPDGAGWVAQR